VSDNEFVSEMLVLIARLRRPPSFSFEASLNETRETIASLLPIPAASVRRDRRLQIFCNVYIRGGRLTQRVTFFTMTRFVP